MVKYHRNGKMFSFQIKVRKYLTRQEITELLSQQKEAWKSTRKHQHKRLADKINRAHKENISDDDDEEDDDGDDDAGSPKRRGKVKRDERFAGAFDRDGKVVKVPVYEEYSVPCSKWFASDEADGLLERELDVGKQTLFFQER